MKLISTLFGLGLSLCLFTGLAQAHGDEDHGATTPKATVTSGGAQRIVLSSELFELVGIVEAGAMTLYLDRYADNSPVTDANIEVEIGSEKLIAATNPNGTYRVVAKAFAKPAETPIIFTISAGEENDLMAGDLIVAEGLSEDIHDDKSLLHNKWLIGGLALLVILTAVIVIRQRRHQKVGTFK